jgi:hypothetical protein
MKNSSKANISTSALVTWAWLAKLGETQSAFVPECLPNDGAIERSRIEERLTEVQREARCVRRAVWLMVVLTGLAAAGVLYSTVFLPFWPQTMTQFFMQWSVKAHCILGLAALMCSVVFSGLDLRYRKELSWHREEYRQLATQPIELRDSTLVPLPIALQGDELEAA